MTSLSLKNVSLGFPIYGASATSFKKTLAASVTGGRVGKETGVTGLVMTRLDGTARGGVLVAAAEKYGLPIHAVGVGESVDDLRPFDPREVARAIAGLERLKER